MTGKKKKNLLLAVLVVSVSVGYLLYPTIFNNLPTTECDKIEDALQRDACIAELSKQKILTDTEKSELYCGKISDPTIKDACNYEIAHTILVAYHTKHKTEKPGLNQISNRLRLVCDKISHYNLRTSCYDEIGRPFLFRKL
jgi:hypothetical protein